MIEKYLRDSAEKLFGGYDYVVASEQSHYRCRWCNGFVDLNLNGNDKLSEVQLKTMILHEKNCGIHQYEEIISKNI